MATNQDIITSAFRKLNVIDENEAPSAEQGVAGLAALNEMLADWQEDGIRIGWYRQTDLSATAPVEEKNLRAVKSNLAVELSGEMGIPAPEGVIVTARESYARLAKSALRYFESDVSMLPQADAGYIFPRC
jgi:hypothetical protein